MKRTLINRLLFAHQKPTQLLVAIAGALFGMFLLLSSIQLYFDLTGTLEGNSDLNQPQYLVINKEVNLLNTLFGGQKGFSDDEIQKLKKIEGVKDVAPLTSSHFKVAVTMGNDGLQGIPGMYTELFFEAVPDNFIDVDHDNWQWNNSDSIVPIIVPRDYIKLYNFGFAPTQGLPQVTESIVGLAKFRITIRGSKANAVYKGKIAGFTERINTILAPKAFLDFANENFAGIASGKQESSRVIIACESSATTELVNYFTGNGYETSAQSLVNSKMRSFLRIIMNVLVAIGSFILLLSFLGFFLYAQLLMSRSSYELETLVRLGFSPKILARRYFNYYNFIFGSVLVFTIFILWIVKGWFAHIMEEKGFAVPGGISISTIVSGLCFTLLFIGINSWNIFRELKRIR